MEKLSVMWRRALGYKCYTRAHLHVIYRPVSELGTERQKQNGVVQTGSATSDASPSWVLSLGTRS